tara:strand:+ start:67 stop:537 length:471 start_codon:yes stop_codon:yes gene_type:complete
MKTNNIFSIEKFKTNIGRNSRLLGIDLGKKRIGVAICDDKRIIATPYKTIIKENFEQFLSELIIIIKDNNISGIVIGNPINMDGSSGASAQSVNDTANLLSKNITLPITLWDERLSSTGAYKLSSQLDVNAVKKIKSIDKNAAAFILQGAIDFINN